ncbi:L,D-transpeptidase family protein [Acetobacter persici]|uniref:L,D-transpeptidase family protein n=1 Tax=Acetobacter persici TaxID=1076596 RepID=UPI0039ECE9A4
MMIHLLSASYSGSDAQLHCGHKVMSAVIGKNGLTQQKQEGDHATPIGIFPLRKVYYRADRLLKPKTILPVEPLSPRDGWCDDPASSDYNHFVRLPHPARHEQLWREDHVYDLIVVIGYNDNPAVPGRGSAIFMHLQRPDRSPTEGCLALTESDLRAVLAAGADAVQVHAPA